MDPDKPAEGAVTPSSAAASVTAEMKQELQKIVMGIVPDIVGRSVKKALTDSLPLMLKEMAPAAATADDGTKKPDEKTGEGGRSLKALETQINELRQQLKTRDEAIEQKEMQRVDALMRGEVREALSGILGADNQHLPLVMDSLYDARKRFVKGEDGQTLVKFKPEYGTDDELLPLGHKDTIKRLTGELKSVMPSKTASLPTVRRGQPVPANGQGGNGVLDSIFNNVVAQAASSASDPTQK